MMPVSPLGSPARGNLRPAPSALPTLRSVRVLDQLRERLRLMHYSLRTEEVYAYWLKAFIRFHGIRHPADMGRPEVEALLMYLANDRNVSPFTHSQALSALLFFHIKVSAVVNAVVAWNEGQAACRLSGMGCWIGFSGFRWTSSMRVQFRVAPDHRRGWRALAAA